MRYIASYFVILLFTLYWIVTLLFVSPDNFIKISLIEGQAFFDTFLFQKWGFFAPPPKHNDRLYYTFINKKDSLDLLTFEVIQPLQKIKTSNAPFNSSADILDYVLSSTVHSVADGLAGVNKSLDYQVETKEIKPLSNIERIKKCREYTETTSNFQTLKNYALIVAQRNNIDVENYSSIVEIAQLDMPKFGQRQDLNLEKNIKESLIFKSNKFELNPK